MALAAGLLLHLATAALPPAAWGQEAPPEDAPAGAFPAGEPAPAGAPAGARLVPQAVAPPMIGGGIWLAKGPGPSIGGQVEAILPGPNEVVGAIHTVAAHPTDPDTLYAGAVNGGIWKTTNATAASPMWTPLTDFETSLSIGALEFDPTDVTHMTLMAGHGLYSSFGSVGGARSGLLKTTDGGASWTPLGGAPSIAAGVNVSGVAPRGATIVATSNFATPFTCLPGGLIGIWRSTDGGATFSRLAPPAGPDGVAFDLASDAASPSTLYTGMTFVPFCSGGAAGFTNGVWKSTDTGATWTKVSDPAMEALIVDGTTNNIEIAADGSDVFVNIIQDGQTVGIFYSSNGGTSWTLMDLPLTPEGSAVGIVGASFAAPITITSAVPLSGLLTGDFVSVTGVTGNTAANGVWQITVTGASTFFLRGSVGNGPYGGGGTYAEVSGLNPKNKPGGQGGIHASIETDPTTPSTVYLGGDRQDFLALFPNFIGATDFTGRLFRGDSTVAATGPPQAIPSPQWDHLTHSSAVAAIPGGGTFSGSAPHADSREMVFDANGDLIEVDDGGIYRRTLPASNTGDWFSIAGNIQVTEQHDVAYDSLSNIIISGNQDTGTTQQLTENGLTWDSVSTADGGDVAVDDSVSPSIRYSSFQNLGSFTKRTWDASNALVGTTPVALTYVGATPGITGIIGNFVTPVELNAVMPGALVLGGCNAVFESFDMGATIIDIPGLIDTDCSPPIITFPQNAITYGGFLGAVPNPDVLYVGSGALLFNRTGPGALSFVSAYPGTETIRDVVLNGFDWREVFVIESNYTTSIAAAPPFFSKVWWSTDSGITWIDITGNLTDVGLQTGVFVPGGPDRLMVGGRDGVFELTLPPPAFPGPYVWGEIGTGLPNAPVWDLDYDVVDGVLVAGTMGRGAWVLQENGACGKPDKLVVNNQWVSGVQQDEACTQITGGPALDVQSGGDLKFKSPLILIDNGFAVKTGGKFEVENAVP